MSTSSLPAPGFASPLRALSGARVRAAVQREGVLLGALAVFAGIAVVLTWATWGDVSRDTGYDLLAGSRSAHGALPYVDYVYYYGPFAPFLLGGVFSVLGTSLAPAIALGLVLAIGILGLTYVVARRLTSPLGAALAAGLVLAGVCGADNSSYILPHSFSAPLAILATLAALAALGREAGGGGRPWLAAAGLASGLVALTRIEFVAALAAGLGGWVVVRLASASRRMSPGAEKRTLRAALTDVAALIGPALAVAGAAWGAVLTSVPLSRLVSENIYPTEQLSQGATHVLKLSAPLTATSFLTLGGRLALYAAGAAALFGLGRLIERGGRRGRAAAALALLAAAGFVAILFINPEAVRTRLQFAYGWIPAGALIAAALLAWRARPRAGGATAQRGWQLACALVLAVLAAKTYDAFFAFPNAAHPQAAVYALPFAALFLAWLHLQVLPRGSAVVRRLGAGWLALLALAGVTLAARDAVGKDVVISGPHGTLRANAADGPAYQAAVRAIVRDTRPGDPILLAPQMSSLYFITGRTNPLPQLSLIPGSLPTSAAQHEAIARLSAVRLAVTDRNPPQGYGAGAFGTGYDRELGTWLRQNFRHVATLRGGPVDQQTTTRTLDLWKRSTP